MQEISDKLLAWYDEHARTLPWRGIRDPYATWVSETMLQQTRVETVLSYYERFLSAFPAVADLAAADEAEVLKLWEGLGYYSRARNLHAGAQQVMTEFGGVIPDTVDALRRVKGVGPYTAGAIASIAYNVPTPAVDGNVIRVVSRLKGIRENVGVPSVRRQIDAAAAALVPPVRPGDFNQALMDLGSGVCTPGTPDCAACPLCGCCEAFAAGDPETIPELPRKSPPKQLNWAVCLILDGDRVLMRRRTEALLNGLWVFPMLEGTPAEKALPAQVKKLTGLTVTGVQPQGETKHVFTHQVWHMQLYVMRSEGGKLKPGWQAVTLQEMHALTLPTAMRTSVRLVEQLLGNPSEPTL